MLRYKTETKPGLVALYDIRPGNGVGPFLQPRSPHGASPSDKVVKKISSILRNKGLAQTKLVPYGPSTVVSPLVRIPIKAAISACCLVRLHLAASSSTVVIAAT